jgi:hypothetical protein
MRLDKLFYKLGFKISENPVIVILLTFITVLLILSGLIFLEFEVNL